MYFWEEDQFVEISGKTFCLECLQSRPGFEHRCYGEPCVCSEPICRAHRGEDLSKDPEYQAFLKENDIVI
ncbi:hypothetical protein SDC9_07982 [bioreactor metagenome]|uniref:Uncharacterized protein n=1 Tax=bioreactor metagenome TaxID=1076179 RepID=A0A644T853_9ZZZZ